MAKLFQLEAKYKGDLMDHLRQLSNRMKLNSNKFKE